MVLESVHTNNRIGNHRKVDEPRKDNVQLVISGKNFAEPFQTQKKTLNLVPLFVAPFVVRPRLPAVPSTRLRRLEEHPSSFLPLA